MAEVVSGAFAQYLKLNRERLNARFSEMRRLRPKLEPTTFMEQLREMVAPLISAIEAHRPEKVAEVAEVAYELSLELVSEDLLGPASRYPFIAEGWRSLFPALAQQVAVAPRALLGAFANALYNLSQWPDARPHEWIASLKTLAPQCADVQTLMQVGQVAAWRAGLAHYRQGALALCRQLDPQLVVAAVGLSVDAKRSLPTLLDNLWANPWLHPSHAHQATGHQAQPKLVARVGAFRGFGGLFMTPPTVVVAGEHFIVSEGDHHWLLTADLFGATFHRADGAATSKTLGAFQITRAGKVSCEGQSQTFAEFDGFTSAAGNTTTLAVTTAHSHGVYLVAMG